MSARSDFDRVLQQKLDDRKAQGLLRSLVYADGKIDFSSNDYLGFAHSSALKNIQEDLSLPSGATGSRLISGNYKIAEDTEKIIARFHQTEAALIFNSGYDANVGLLSSIPVKGDVIISDEYNHASIIDGSRLSLASRLKFKHNDLVDLERKLNLPADRKFVVVESIYSMDGDEAPLIDIANLCEKYNALMIVDEAHATGVFGDRGEGLVGYYKLEDKVFARVHTFGKALGLHGAIIVGSAVLRDYLINHARSFIYTTALPPQHYHSIQKAYEMLSKADSKGLHSLIAYFKKASTSISSNIKFIESNSPIQGIVVRDNFKAKTLAEHLQNKNFFVRAILSPTVPAGTERLRICLHTFNTKEQIDQLIGEVKKFLL
ncbi:MAG TPA: 8-amino-7-oxononanoate synthase [Cyclobacteriaceae bacterium]|jgi:8-amino-7-oxononanoate synthase|nr:8-amino-7-oxononanoate synthase [Cyclobacteriaceae bacterium]